MTEHGDIRANEAVIPPSIVAGLVEIGEQEGHSVASWFAGTGLEPVEILTSASVKLSFRQAATILRRGLRAMPGRPLGMQVGTRDTLLSWGMLGVAMRSCATAGDALAVARELHQASGSLVDVEVETSGGEIALRLEERQPEPELIAFLCEEAFSSIAVLIRGMVGAGWSPARIELAYPAVPYLERYQSFFRCGIRVGADANRLIFPASDLARPLPTHHEPTLAVAIETCRRLLGDASGRLDIVATVEMLLGRNLREALTMADAASHLHLTERTLRRQLAAAGERFSTIRDRVRERRATFLLRETTLTVDAIAHETGFSDGREFRRAYIRWTGMAPSMARRR